MAQTTLRLRRKTSKWACRGQKYAGLLGVMARITLACHAVEGFSRIGRLFVVFLNLRLMVIKVLR
jgi:hypothetical protein